MDKKNRKTAYEYHENPPGKWRASPSKVLANQRDLCLAYTPYVADVCKAIAEKPALAKKYTNKGNLVAVISNGTAVLGLGDIGPLGSKPVMEGKAVLLQRFGGLNAVDIEIDEKDPLKLAQAIKAISPSFGAINLEDIKAPECFFVEKFLQDNLDIPVFHDDQHGTAVVVGAALINALRLTNRTIGNIRCVVNGAGAAALCVVDFLKGLGVSPSKIVIFDSQGAIHEGRSNLDDHKRKYACFKSYSSIGEALEGADLLIGLSVGNSIDPKALLPMAKDPIIFALANPTPDVCPESIKKLRPDAIFGTGRSDYPNQINNLLCFPYIFRGAIDGENPVINALMKKACSFALAHLACCDFFDISESEEGQPLRFGRNYLIPSPFDVRLLETVVPAVLRAAQKSGAGQTTLNMEAYTKNLHHESLKFLDPFMGMITYSSYDGRGDKNPLETSQSSYESSEKKRAYRPLILIDQWTEDKNFLENFTFVGSFGQNILPTLGVFGTKQLPDMLKSGFAMDQEHYQKNPLGNFDQKHFEEKKSQTTIGQCENLAAKPLHSITCWKDNDTGECRENNFVYTKNSFDSSSFKDGPSWIDLKKLSFTHGFSSDQKNTVNFTSSLQKNNLLSVGLYLLKNNYLEHLVIGWSLTNSDWKNLCSFIAGPENFSETESVSFSSKESENCKFLNGLLVSGSFFLDDSSIERKKKGSLWKAQWYGNPLQDTKKCIERLLRGMFEGGLNPEICVDISFLDQYFSHINSALDLSAHKEGSIQDKNTNAQNLKSQYIHQICSEIHDLCESLSTEFLQTVSVLHIGPGEIITTKNHKDMVVLSWAHRKDPIIHQDNVSFGKSFSKDSAHNFESRHFLEDSCFDIPTFFLGKSFDIQCFPSYSPLLKCKDFFSLFFHPIVGKKYEKIHLDSVKCPIKNKNHL